MKKVDNFVKRKTFQYKNENNLQKKHTKTQNKYKHNREKLSRLV